MKGKHGEFITADTARQASREDFFQNRGTGGKSEVTLRMSVNIINLL